MEAAATLGQESKSYTFSNMWKGIIKGFTSGSLIGKYIKGGITKLPPPHPTPTASPCFSSALFNSYSSITDSQVKDAPWEKVDKL